MACLDNGYGDMPDQNPYGLSNNPYYGISRLTKYINSLSIKFKIIIKFDEIWLIII